MSIGTQGTARRDDTASLPQARVSPSGIGPDPAGQRKAGRGRTREQAASD